MPKPSAKSYEIWGKYMDWLRDQKIETIVDFEPWVMTKYEMSTDGDYIKKQSKNEIIYYGKGAIRYGQQIYEKIEGEIMKEWKKIIAELKPNGVLEVYGVFHTHQEQRETHYFPFDERMTESMQRGDAVAVTDEILKIK